MGRKLTDSGSPPIKRTRGGHYPDGAASGEQAMDAASDEDAMDSQGQEAASAPEHRQRRSRMRPRTIAGRRLTRAEIQEGIELVDDMWYERPKTRAAPDARP